MVCSLWIYIDLTHTPIRVQYETTCELAYKCAKGGCKTLATKGSTVRWEEKASSLGDILPSTPSNPSLYTPFPPFSPADITVIVDSSPKIDVYGLPLRRSTVISTTKRTVLEGNHILQLVTNRDGVMEVNGVFVVDGWLGFELSAPLYPRELVEKHDVSALHCHDMLNLEEWGKCMYRNYKIYNFIEQYINRMGSLMMKRRYGADLVAAMARTYAGAAIAANIDPLSYAEVLIAADLEAPLVSEESHLKIVAPKLVLGLKCGDKIAYIPLRRGSTIKTLDKCSIAFLCRDCWMSIDRVVSLRRL